jgi:sec-independent protein translocase protein TatA
MGIVGNSPGSLLLTLLIVLVVFGGKRLRSVGEDLGAAVRGFRKGLRGIENEISQLDNDELNK